MLIDPLWEVTENMHQHDQVELWLQNATKDALLNLRHSPCFLFLGWGQTHRGGAYEEGVWESSPVFWGTRTAATILFVPAISPLCLILFSIDFNRLVTPEIGQMVWLLSQWSTKVWGLAKEAGLWCIRTGDGEYRALTTPCQVLNLEKSIRVCIGIKGHCFH